jgi:spore coat protein U-like protein
MKKRHYHPMSLIILIGALCLQLHAAHAVTCSTFSSPGWSVTYDPNAAPANTTTSSVNITCTRQSGDHDSVTLTVAANSGMQPTGTINQAKTASGSLIQYNNYTDAAHTLVWGTGGSTLSIPFSFGSGGPGATATATATFYAMIPAGQTTASNGIYNDIVTMTLLQSGAIVATGTFLVTAIINPYCAISTPPGTIAFSYASFQNTSATGSTSFAATCTNTLPYTISLDATSGTLLGLNYTLSAPAGTYTGTGLAQSYVINGTIAARQGGTCASAACTGSAAHTLTITY